MPDVTAATPGLSSAGPVACCAGFIFRIDRGSEMPTERFMQQHYGASGFVAKCKKVDEVSEDARVAVAKFCQERDLNYTLGTMLEMARFAEEYTAKIASDLRLAQEHGAKAEIRLINAENSRRRQSLRG